jgi:hypothetical protein
MQNITLLERGNNMEFLIAFAGSIYEGLRSIFDMILQIEPDAELANIFDAILGLFK